MAEAIQRTEITELADHKEARGRLQQTKSKLQEKLGSLIGATIDITGYPQSAIYQVQSRDLRIPNKELLRAVPVYPLFAEDPPEPRSMSNRTLERADGKYIWVSSSEAGVQELEPHPDALGKVVAYTFEIDNILSLSVVEATAADDVPAAGHGDTA